MSEVNSAASSIDESVWWYENNYGPHVNKRAVTEIRLMAAKIDEQHDQARRMLQAFWGILNGIIANGDGDTLWANEFVTAHEALVEMAHEYDPDLAAIFNERLGNGDLRQEVANE
jgi:hypothetical protein